MWNMHMIMKHINAADDFENETYKYTAYANEYEAYICGYMHINMRHYIKHNYA